MIINGGSRSNGRFFASHLMRADHNERVEVRDIRGLIAGNIADALREMREVASGTACKNYFYHADINTREDERLTPEQWTKATDALERELNLTGQPRFIVEHEKNGRVHQHIIWSRIDIDSMTAISDSHNYRRHEAVARAMEKAFGHEPTPGTLSREFGTERPERCPKDWESFRAQESKIDPKVMKAEVTTLWNSADSGQAFAAAVAEQGYILARGDRRDFCIIDRAGDEHSLARQVSGVKAAQIRARMADVDREALPSVTEARQLARLHWEEATGGGGSTPPQETEMPAPERIEPPLSDFDAILAETQRAMNAPAGPDTATLSPELAAILAETIEQAERHRQWAARYDAPPEQQADASPPLAEDAPAAPLSAFEAILAETLASAAADASQAARDEQASRETGGRFGRWNAWLNQAMKQAGDWGHQLAELVLGFFGRDGRADEPEHEQQTEWER